MLCRYPTILILDSGVGGLFVYQSLRCLLPYVHYLYFFDNEAFPYGERSSKFIFDRVMKISKKVSQYHRVDLVIFACNTITVLLLEKLRDYFLFPIIGVVPNISLGVQSTRNGVIGVLATYRTVNSELILGIVNRFSMSYKFLFLSSSELVKISENKILYNKQVSLSLLRDIFSPWLNILGRPDTIILGCTHFLHLEEEFRVIFSNNVCFVGFSKCFVFRIIQLLSNNGIDIYRVNDGVGYKIENRAYCSVITEEVLAVWSLILRNYNFASLQEISI